MPWRGRASARPSCPEVEGAWRSRGERVGASARVDADAGDAIVRRRLRTQRLTGAGFATPEDVVGWLGAVQSQDYGPAKWAVGRRQRRARDAAVERAFTEGRILRTHVLRSDLALRAAGRHPLVADRDGARASRPATPAGTGSWAWTPARCGAARSCSPGHCAAVSS